MHTHSSEHTPGAVGSHIAAPGEQLWDRCLAQGSHLSRGIEGGESTCYSLPPPTIPAGPGNRTGNLCVTSPRVNPISLSYPFPLPLPLSFARSRESKGCPNSHFDRGVGLRARGRYPLKPSIFASLLETKGYPEHTAQPATMSARSSRESHFRLK